MLYVDTGALVALCTNEEKTAAVVKWYASCVDELASAAWCVTEFGSALGIKQRTGQLTAAQAWAAWRQFDRICANDLQLLPVAAMTFHRAAMLTMDVAAGLRAGDALHIACAMEANAHGIVTLDKVMAANAKRFKIRLTPI